MRLLISFILLFTASFVSTEDLFTTYQKAQDAAKAKDYPKFLLLSEEMLQKASGHSGVQFQYARALVANEKNEEAIKILQKVARMGGAPPVKEDELFSRIQNRKEFQSLLSLFEENRKTSGKSAVAFTLNERDLIPEGIAYDPVQNQFYIGSTYRRKIVQVNAAGGVTDFTREKQDGLWGLVGMEVDPVRRILWACTANNAETMKMIDPDPATEGKTAIFKYDLKTGKLVNKYETGSKKDPRFFNDVAVSKNGDVFISESTAGEIYKISAKNDTLELLSAGGTRIFPNGIAISDDAKFLYVSHLEGITVVHLDSGESRLLTSTSDAQLGSHDGMVYFKKSLIGIQALTGGVERIVRLHLQNPEVVDRVEALQVNHPLFMLPTTGDVKENEFYYIANSQLRSFDEKGNIFPPKKLKDPVILKISLE